MIDAAKLKPRTVYVTYIAATPEKVWQALTDPAFTAQYFFGRTIEVEPRAGGSFLMRMPDGRVDMRGEVIEWSPPRRLATTWTIDWNADMRQLPPCLVRYDIEPAGDSVRLTLTESYSWEVPEALLSGGRAGWPAILSSLKSMLEKLEPQLEQRRDAIRERLGKIRSALKWVDSFNQTR